MILLLPNVVLLQWEGGTLCPGTNGGTNERRDGGTNERTDGRTEAVLCRGRRDAVPGDGRTEGRTEAVLCQGRRDGGTLSRGRRDAEPGREEGTDGRTAACGATATPSQRVAEEPLDG
ncbi:hypothetical protein CRUP_030273 [Coryphaenoides rupestris]|nr:hypothetical protein CRUP_030273 [Coryphaenoides rupestris]